MKRRIGLCIGVAALAVLIVPLIVPVDSTGAAIAGPIPARGPALTGLPEGTAQTITVGDCFLICEDFDDGLPPDWTFESDPNHGEIIVVDGHLQMHNPGGESTNTATKVYDLSGVDPNEHVLLTFRWHNPADDSDDPDEDRVFVMGEPPIELHSLPETGEYWEDAAILLDDFGVAYTDHVEIVFQQQDDFEWPYDGIRVDDVCVGIDCNLNGVIDALEIAANPDLDCDENCVLDSCQIDEDSSLDCAGGPDCIPDGVLDVCQLDPNTTDCDDNGVLDSCEICENPALDCDNDGTLDACQEWCNNNADGDDDDDGVTNFCDQYPGYNDLYPEAVPWVEFQVVTTALGDESEFTAYDPNGFDDVAQYYDLKAWADTVGSTRFDNGETFNVEIWVTNLKGQVDPNDPPPGILCGNIGVDLCGACELTVNEPLEHGASLSTIPSGDVGSCGDPNAPIGRIEQFGGCVPDFAPEHGVCINYCDWEWILVGRFTVTTPLEACCGDSAGEIQLLDPDVGLWGIGQVDPDDVYLPDPVTITTKCRAWMYDLNGDCWVDIFDLGHGVCECGELPDRRCVSFIDSWLSCEDDDPPDPWNPYCELFDWDCNGCVGPGDLGFWATAYDKDCDVEEIVLPPVWPCGGPMPEPCPPVVAPASDEFIQSLGLPVPPEDWRGHHRRKP